MRLLWIFVPTPLVAGRREDPVTISQFHHEPFSVQEVAASVVHVNTAPPTGVCFKTHILFSHWGNTSSDRQLKGDIECVPTASGSLNLAAGNGVWLSQSTDLVMHETKKHGFSVKSVSMDRVLTVLGVETSRTVNAVEKMHAKYLGSEKPEGAQMVVAGIDWPFAKHACFELSSALSRATIPVEGKTVEEMPQINQNGVFCIRIGDQSSTTQETINGLIQGNLVTMTILYSVVRYETTGGDEELKWDIDVSLHRGTQVKAHWINYGANHLRKTPGTFQGATPSAGGVIKFCFRLGGGDIQCFEKHLQDASIQATLLNLEKETNVELSWENEWITYENNPYSTGDAESKDFIRKIDISTTH